MKMRSLPFIFCFLLFQPVLKAQDVKELFEGKVAARLLLNDLAVIRKDLEKNHPQLHWFIDETRLNEKFDSLKKSIRIPLTRMEFRYQVLTVLQSIGDGHLSLIMDGSQIKPEAYESYAGNRILPVQQFNYKVIGTRLFVVGGDEHTHLAPGTEIVAMNGLSAADVITKLINGLSADGFNSSLKYFVLNSGSFSTVYSDTFGRQDSVNFRIRDAAGERSVMIRSASGQKNAGMVLSAPKMRAEQTVNQGFAVLNVSNFNTVIPQNYNFFFGNLKFKGINTLVLDLRNNTGGEQSVVTELFSYLINEPSYFAVVPDKILDDPEKTPMESMKIGIRHKVVPNKNAFKGKLYVLINGGSFSATAILAANLQALNKNIVFVGEESGGGRAGCTAGSFRTVALKNSNLSLRYGNIPIKSIAEKGTLGRGVVPDAVINYTIGDYVAKRDLEMEWLKADLMR